MPQTAKGTDQAVIRALQEVAKENGGLLRPDDVIDAARPVSSPLHCKFTWDDTEAAHKWRQEQARYLLRVTVQYITPTHDPVRVFVSLTPDREEEGGGYRTLVSVMSDKDMRQQLLEDAFEEMQRFRAKYGTIKELAEVFAAMSRAERKRLKAVA